jgi:crossover junction endodeoxyribonuclease RuvC
MASAERDIVMGIDPGTHHCGYGLVARRGTRFVHIAHGVIHAVTKDDLAHRLRTVADGVGAVVAEHKPASVGIEQAFVHLDPKAALFIGHARGVVMVECVRAGLEVAEYAPTVIKRAVVGTGRADKTQVNAMIRVLLGLAEAPPLDASDALAIAICHASALGFTARVDAATKEVSPLGALPVKPPAENAATTLWLAASKRGRARR